MRVLIAMAALMIAVSAMAQTAPDASPEFGVSDTYPPVSETARSQIERGMEDSATGWNEGDVDRFLAIYSDNPATSFTGSDGVSRGKTGIRARYLKGYPNQFGPQSTPGKRSVLTFTFEDYRPIGRDHVLLIARWRLVTGEGEANVKTGMTSLLFRHEAGGWKIIADHSS